MARGINKVILIGNLGSDPDLRYLPNGNAVATLSLATTEAWKDKNTGDKQEKTEWHRVVCFARLGEIAGEYLRKGAKVYIEGSLRTRKWQDQQGQDRYTTEIIANDLQMLDGKTGGGGGGGSFPSYDDVPQAQSSYPGTSASQAQSAYSAASAPQAQPLAAEVLNELDDDVPF